MKDYYKILGIPRDASVERIKRAYRDSIKRCHPDSLDCDMTAEDLYNVQEAYEILGDRRKRAEYDAILPTISPSPDVFARSGRPLRRSGPAPQPSRSVFDTFSSLFERFFTITPHIRNADTFDSRSIPPHTRRCLEIYLTRYEAMRGGVFDISVPDAEGRTIGRFSLRIPPGVSHGSIYVVNLAGIIGTPGDVEITVLHR
ncbi:MAG: DnaJ domain-containing protein [Deltaproteobacteria bacterium]|nr:DnaJ domain-containing protein [Candidatus Zymogenaceae bacterium]